MAAIGATIDGAVAADEHTRLSLVVGYLGIISTISFTLIKKKNIYLPNIINR